MENKTYSIIIPFRDCVNFLRNACNSIPTRPDIQVIVVDNAQEPIGCNAIRDFDNPNVEYYTSSPTKGAGCARNEGLKHAKGKYLLFLDADDYFTENAFSIFDEYVNGDNDIVYFNATSIKLSNGQPSNRHLTIDDKIKKYLSSNNEDFLRYLFLNPVCKLVKRELLEKYNIRFQEVPASNDVMFSMWTGHSAKRITAVDKPVYVITEGEAGSSLVKTKSLRNQKSRFYVLVDRIRFLSSIKRNDLQPRVISYIFNAYKDFGAIEAMRWLAYAIKKGVNPLKF